MKAAPSYAQNRLQVVPILAQKFLRDYEEVIEPFEPAIQLRIIQHLTEVVELFRLQEPDMQEAAYEQYNTKEESLFKEFGKTLVPYVRKQFSEYFYPDMVILVKDVYHPDEANNLQPADTKLSEEEYQQFLKICRNALYNAKRFLYLQLEPSALELASKTGTSNTSEDEPEKEFTKARQLLAIYFLLKAGFNVEHRDGQSVSDVARLAHLLTGTKLTSIQNSDIYKKYRLMPAYKEGKALLEDLTSIRPNFAALKLDTALTLIDAMIVSTTKKLKKV